MSSRRPVITVLTADRDITVTGAGSFCLCPHWPIMKRDLNPQRYLQQVFETLPLIAEEDTQSLEKLLPWNIAQ